MRSVKGVVVLLLLLRFCGDLFALSVPSFFTNVAYKIQVNSDKDEFYDKLKGLFSRIIKENNMDVSKFSFNDEDKSICVEYDWETFASMFYDTDLALYFTTGSIPSKEAILKKRFVKTAFKDSISVLDISGFVRKVEEFLEQARKFFDEKNFSKQDSIEVKVDFSEEYHKVTENILEQVFAKDSKYRGLGVGEAHTSASVPEFLINNMEKFEKLGMKIIFSEWFKVSYQPYIDRYLDSSSDEIPYELQKKGLALEILKAAKKHGIRVMGIDSALARLNVKDNDEGDDRVFGFNYFAYKKIRKVLGSYDDNSKYVVHTGDDHIVDTEVPGLSRMLNLFSLTIFEDPFIQYHSLKSIRSRFFKESPPYYVFDKYKNRLMCIADIPKKDLRSKLRIKSYSEIRTFEELNSFDYRLETDRISALGNVCTIYSRISHDKSDEWKKDIFGKAIEFFNKNKEVFLRHPDCELELAMPFVFLALANISPDQTLEYLKIFIQKLFEKDRSGCVFVIIKSFIESRLLYIPQGQREFWAELCGSLNLSNKKHLEIIEKVLCNYIVFSYENCSPKDLPVNALRNALSVNFDVSGKDYVQGFDLRNDEHLEIVRKVVLAFFEKQSWNSGEIQEFGERGWFNDTRMGKCHFSLDNKKHLALVLDIWEIVKDKGRSVPEYILSQLDSKKDNHVWFVKEAKKRGLNIESVKILLEQA